MDAVFLTLVLAVPAAGGDLFVDRTAELGIDFRHHNGRTGRLHYVEILGAGGAVFDADGDGDLDLYLIQGQNLDRSTDPRLRDRLYRNDLVETGRLGFTDVTEEAGLDARGYGMGIAAGDVDNDGDVDLYVTNYGPNQLWLNESSRLSPRGNQGGETQVRLVFRDATAAAGVDDPRWSLATAFLDYDGDGWLDLYVGNYLDFHISNSKHCPAPTGERDYCGPLGFDPVPDRLLRNLGAKGATPKFEDVTARVGLAVAATSMGVVTGDFDGDGRDDLYVANDAMANQLWLNQGGTFVDDALLAGCAFNLDGKAEGSMGIAAGDVDGDGREDLFVTHLVHETHTLYLNRGEAAFLDGTVKSGLGAKTWLKTGFGTALFDMDLDGDLDAMVVNGAVQNFDRGLFEEQAAAWILPEEQTPTWRLHQPNQLFRNDGGGRFTDVSAEAGAAFHVAEVSRGLTVGDLDNDGDQDAVVHNNGGPVRVLLNEHARRPWVGVRCVGGDKDRDMLGARVGLRSGDGFRWQRLRVDGSYASSRDPRLVWALERAQPSTVRVVWPGGGTEDFTVEPERYTTLRQGHGRAPE